MGCGDRVRSAELSVNEEVFVNLPYDGGYGWAALLSLEGRRARIRFLAGEARMTSLREREVDVSRIYATRKPMTKEGDCQ